MSGLKRKKTKRAAPKNGANQEYFIIVLLAEELGITENLKSKVQNLNKIQCSKVQTEFKYMITILNLGLLELYLNFGLWTLVFLSDMKEPLGCPFRKALPDIIFLPAGCRLIILMEPSRTAISNS